MWSWRPAVWLAGTGGTGSSGHHRVVEGFPQRYVCIYPSTNWNGGVPSLKFLTYGYHNLTNVTGHHRIFNNQTGGASAYGCSGYGGTRQRAVRAVLAAAGRTVFTPVNSVVLNVDPATSRNNC